VRVLPASPRRSGGQSGGCSLGHDFCLLSLSDRLKPGRSSRPDWPRWRPRSVLAIYTRLENPDLQL